jgi:hypothetical protein
MLAACGRVDGEPVGSARPDGGAADAATSDGSVPSVPPTKEVVVELPFVLALAVAEGAAYVAVSGDGASDIRRIEPETGATSTLVTDVAPLVDAMLVADQRVIWAEHDPSCDECLGTVRAVPTTGGDATLIATVDERVESMVFESGRLWLVHGASFSGLDPETGEVTTIATGADGALAANGGSVFVTLAAQLARYDVAAEAISKLGIPVGFGRMRSSAVSAGTWYWATTVTLHSVPLSGDAFFVVPNVPLLASTLRVPEWLYWLEPGAGGCNGRVVRADGIHGPYETWATGCEPYLLETDAEHAYFVESLSVDVSRLSRVPLQ